MVFGFQWNDNNQRASYSKFLIKLPEPPVYCSLSQDRSSFLKAARAFARWLILFLISGPSWDMVAPYSGTQKTGS